MKKMTYVLSIGLLALVLAACGGEATPTPPPPTDAPPPTESAEESADAEPTMAPPVISDAPVSQVTLDQQDDQTVAVVQGSLTDGCTQLHESQQSVSGDAIEISLTTARPADMMCTQVVTEFTEEIVVDTADLADGTYSVSVNGVAADQPLTVGEAASAEVTGTVTYRQRIALPDDAILSVQVQDISMADAPAEMMGEQTTATEGAQVPLPFAVAYNPAEIQENHQYGLSVRITDGEGKLLFINDTVIPVITNGSPTTDVEVVVVPVGAGPEAGETSTSVADLVNRTWQWERRQLPDGGQVTVASPANYTLAFTEDGTYLFQADCNSGSGIYTADDEGNIIMEAGIMTLAECGPDSQYQEMVESFTAVETFQVQNDGDGLVLVQASGVEDIYSNAGEVTGAEAAGEGAGLPEEFLGIPWEWVSFTDPATGPVDIDEPANYQIQFEADGTVFIKADCNNGSGIYSVSDGSISIIVGPMTRAFCGEESLDSQYLLYLEAVAIWFTLEEDLLFDLKFDSGTMRFTAAAEDNINESEAPESESSGTLSADAIQLDLQGLAETYEWTAVPGIPPSPGPGGAGMPAHLLLTFDGEDAEEAVANGGRYMYIFPVETYEQVGGNSVTAQVERLEALIASADGRVENPEDPMPLLPPPSSFMNRWVQFADLSFTQGTGVRYVSEAPNRQAIGPWTNQGTAYYYQGLTEDGRFYISLHWPVSTEALPDTFDEAPEDVKAQATDPETYEAYLQETKDTLNALDASDWDPDLARLDALVASITFQ